MPASTDPLLDALLAGIERELASAVDLRRRLHERPELAHEEELTAQTIAEALPVPCREAAGTGRLALLGAGNHARPVAVRAELDGLPVVERTSAPFGARAQTMHACGHDVHMAALVALARAAHAIAADLPAPLLAIFQPSEEAHPSGAQLIAKGELVALTPRAVLAAHVHPELPWGSVSLDAGAVNASCDTFEIAIEGEPTHGAYPHHGRDPILALAAVVVALHAQIGRRIDPLAGASLTVGTLQGGSAENVIPGQARATGALRALAQDERRALAELTEEVVEGVARAHGCVGRVTLTPGEPPLENDPSIVSGAVSLLAQAGLARAAQWRSCGSDDFAFFGALAPVAMAFVGLDGAPGFRRRPLHHPELLVPDEAVGAVARTQAALYVAGARLG